jgi:pyrroloquinoline quinone (PQQ) biosynthesis protein C
MVCDLLAGPAMPDERVQEAGAARLKLLSDGFDGDRAGAAAAIRSFVLEALHVDARIVDLCLAQPHRLAALMRGLGAVCRAGVEGDAEADALLHALLAQLYDGVLRIPGLDRWRGYGSVTVQAIQARLERYAVDALRARAVPVTDESPAEPQAFVHWLRRRVAAHRATGHPFYTRHMRLSATVPDLRQYFIQELTVDGRFDDLVALMQVGSQGGAKLELAQNYWDEMGGGDARGVHTDLFARVITALGITDEEIERARTHESRLCGNLSVLLASQREHFYRAAGYFGVLELMVPARMVDVLRAWERNRLPPEAMEYHRVHVPIDARHASGWFRNVIAPAVARDPETRRHVIEGAMWRLETSCWYLDALLADAGRQKELRS